MKPIPILINGLPGNMCQIVLASAIKDSRFHVVPFSITGPDIKERQFDFSGLSIGLIHPEHHRQQLIRIRGEFPNIIAVDYTHPSAVNQNAELYCSIGLPFVMGTTGGNRTLLPQTVLKSETVAVIAPNMAKPIVALQAMLEWASKEFPGLFSGYKLNIVESHQMGKADTSGTAKAMVDYFNGLGIPFEASEIRMIRDPQTQKDTLGVPETFLGGHGWHTYSLNSQDGTVKVELTHNVNGRDVYALGTLDAAAYLAAKVQIGEKGMVYSMMDVLKGK
jgi:4-hydroxy-tetrahydrodipicolinate reductase